MRRTKGLGLKVFINMNEIDRKYWQELILKTYKKYRFDEGYGLDLAARKTANELGVGKTLVDALKVGRLL